MCLSWPHSCPAQFEQEPQHDDFLGKFWDYLWCFGRAGDMQIDEAVNDVTAAWVQLSHEGHLEAIKQGLLHSIQRQGSSAVLQGSTQGA